MPLAAAICRIFKLRQPPQEAGQSQAADTDVPLYAESTPEEKSRLLLKEVLPEELWASFLETGSFVYRGQKAIYKINCFMRTDICGFVDGKTVAHACLQLSQSAPRCDHIIGEYLILRNSEAHYWKTAYISWEGHLGMYTDFQEEIRRRAYKIWEERRKYDTPGSDEEDWLRAEAELRLSPTKVKIVAHALSKISRAQQYTNDDRFHWFEAQFELFIGLWDV